MGLRYQHGGLRYLLIWVNSQGNSLNASFSEWGYPPPIRLSFNSERQKVFYIVDSRLSTNIIKMRAGCASLEPAICPFIGVDHPYQLHQCSHHLYKWPAVPKNQTSYHGQDNPDTDRIFPPPRCTHASCIHTIHSRLNSFLTKNHAGISGRHHSTAQRKVKLNRLLTVRHSSKNATFCTMFDFPMFQRSVSFVGSLLISTAPF